MDIEKELFPEAGILKKDEEGTYSTTIVDAELDPFKCTFNNDDCVEIDTSRSQYITLTLKNLYDLIDLIEKAEELYEEDNSDELSEDA